eukprot:1725361-Alexandrium_andersonii.AAC.1
MPSLRIWSTHPAARRMWGLYPVWSMCPYRAWMHCLARLQATWRLGVCGLSASASPLRAAMAASAAWAISWR